jgi:DNA (cytosine-5)-methyltransferase 1
VGGECIFASEIGVEERLTYFVNFGSFPAGDITETPTSAIGGGSRCGDQAGSGVPDAPVYELLTAGFPCQSFCKAGLKTGTHTDHTQQTKTPFLSLISEQD